jgi:hypothetical protein
MKLTSILSATVLVVAVTSLSGTAQGSCGANGGWSGDRTFRDLVKEVAQRESRFHGIPRNNAIVGLWKIALSAGGNVIDAGYQTWHDDGTELMNSGRPPMTGSFCMGAYEKAGPRRYKLNHFALAWLPSGTAPDGTDNIKMDVQLGPSGDTFTGTFSLDHYDVNGNLVDHKEGTISATRITVE